MAASSSSGKRFIRVAGTAKRYRDTQTGHEYSYRQYLKLNETQGKPAPKRQSADRQMAVQRGIMLRSHSIKLYQERQANLGKEVKSKRDTGNSEAFKKAYAAYRKETGPAKGHTKNKNGSANQNALKRALTDIGLREGVAWKVPVGETNANR